MRKARPDYNKLADFVRLSAQASRKHLCTANRSDDTPYAHLRETERQLLRLERDERDRKSRWPRGRRCHVPAARRSHQSRRKDLEGLPKRRARFERSTRQRARPHRLGTLVQRQPPTDRERSFRAPFPHRRRQPVRRRTGTADQRPVDRVADPRGTRHPHWLECGRHVARWSHVLRLDVCSNQRHGSGRTLRRPGAQPELDASAVILELGAHRLELLEHRAAWWCRTDLLLRAVTSNPASSLARSATRLRAVWPVQGPLWVEASCAAPAGAA